MTLVYLSIAFLAGTGLALATSTSVRIIELALLVALILVTTILGRKAKSIRMLGGIAILFILGVWMASESTPIAVEQDWSQIPRHEERVTLTGVLSDDPAPANEATRLRLMVDDTFNIDVYTETLMDQSGERRSDEFVYGDSYLVSGRFHLVTSRTDIAGTISTQNVELVEPRAVDNFRSAIAQFRSIFSTHLNDSINGDSGALASAMLIGDRSKLSQNTIQNFRSAGLSHVLAISGLHLVLVGGSAMVLAVQLLGRRRQFYLIVPFTTAWSYALIAGMSPSVTRAAIMFSVYLLARLLGRQRRILPALSLAAVSMVVLEPGVLKTISFQLSFAAVLGIAVMAPKVSIQLRSNLESFRVGPAIVRKFGWLILDSSIISVSAILFTTPLVLLHFGTSSTWGVFSTLAVSPVLPLFIWSSVATLSVDLIGTPVTSIVALTPLVSGGYIAFVAEVFAGFPGGNIDATSVGISFVLFWYSILFVGLNFKSISLLIERISSTKSIAMISSQTSLRNPLLGVAALLILVLAGFAITNPKSEHLTVVFFETDRGDMILIEAPGGQRMLVDGGDNADRAVQIIKDHLPLNDRRIDVVLSTHPDADHVGGLERIIEQFDVSQIIDSGANHDSQVFRSWKSEIARQSDVVEAVSGTVVRLDNETAVTILQTKCVIVQCSAFNDESVVARLDHQEVSFLLTGDITTAGESDLSLTGQNISTTVLKVPHHGSKTSTSDTFLTEVDPALAVVTTGIKNQFGHPHDEVMERLHQHLDEEAIFVTRDNGTVTVTTDGSRVWVKSDR